MLIEVKHHDSTKPTLMEHINCAIGNKNTAAVPHEIIVHFNETASWSQSNQCLFQQRATLSLSRMLIGEQQRFREETEGKLLLLPSVVLPPRQSLSVCECLSVMSAIV